MLLQVHDELVFDMAIEEESELKKLVEDKMTKAIDFNVPLKIEMGVGGNWLEAH